MLVNGARKFCNKGYFCLRLDVRGRGNSSGEIKDSNISSMSADAQAALNFLKQEYSPEKIVVLGQCQGGRAVLQLSEADGYIMWSAPPLDRSLKANIRKSNYMLFQYIKKLFNKNAWYKFIAGELKYALIWEALLGHFRRSNIKEKNNIKKIRAQDLGKKNCLFIYGEKDPDTVSACRIYKELCCNLDSNAEFNIIKGANHSFYSIDSEREVLDNTMEWLNKYF